jgi:hypothetical protein
MGHLIHDDDWPDFKHLMADYRSGRLKQLGGSGRGVPGPRPNIRAILLADLDAGDTVEAAVTRWEPLDEVQQITFGGTVLGGTFQLTFGGQTTAEMPWNATAAEVQAALEALGSISPGDVIVTAYSGRFLVHFTGQFAAGKPALMAAVDHLDGNRYPNAITITQAFDWVDAGRTEKIHGQMPVGTPTPLKAGAVVTGGWIPEGPGAFCIVNVECRDLDLTDPYA